MLVILVVPPGAEDSPICHGNEAFAPYRADHLDHNSGWLVAVTPQAAVALLHKGGFSLYAPPMRRRLSGDMAYMIHKEGPRSCSWDGEAYEPDVHGRVRVPVESQEDMFSHGVVGAPPLPEAESETPKQPTAKVSAKAAARV